MNNIKSAVKRQGGIVYKLNLKVKTEIHKIMEKGRTASAL